MSDGEEITAASPLNEDTSLCRELTVVDTVDATPISTAPFDLPDDWVVKRVPRDGGKRDYKVYYEPGTGRRFESLRAVEKHLKGADCTLSPEASKSESCFEKFYERRNRKKVLPLIADDKYLPGSERKSYSKERKSSPKALKLHKDYKSSRVRKSIISDGKLLKLDNKKFVSPNAKGVDSPFDLPDGWVIEEVPRRHEINHIDRYFYEPVTGRKFCSLLSVRRHLAEAEEVEEAKPLAEMFSIGTQDKSPHEKKRKASSERSPSARKSIVPGGKSPSPRKSSVSVEKSPARKSLVFVEKSSSERKSVASVEKSCSARRSVVSGGKLLKLDDKESLFKPEAESEVSSFDLPDGWVVEEVPRRNKTNGHSDKYYYEPRTGKKFASLASAKRHLEEAEEEDKPLSLMFNIESPSKKLDSENKSPKENKTSSEKMASTETFGPATPPAKIKWVLTDYTDGSTFKPAIEEEMVAESVVQRWAKRFAISVSGEDHPAPSFEH